MSCYLGFEPTDRPNYFFVSYNSEDVGRITPIAKSLFHAGVPLWYDFGLEYGEKWESQISGKIMNSQALLLFFTKGILEKQNSYVRKEYEMATRFFDRKVFVVMMDKIENKDVPFDRVPWWIDVQENQSIDVTDTADLSVIVSRVSRAIGMETGEDRMNRLIGNYQSLYGAGRREEAEAYLAEYLHGQSLAGKAQTIRNIINHCIEGMNTACVTEVRGTLDTELIDHAGNRRSSFSECHRITLGDTVLTVGNSFVFHRGNRGDAHVLNIWRNKELMYTLGGLIDAYGMQVYYDRSDDILYICFSSAKEEVIDGEVEETFFQTTVTVESPGADAVCSVFRDDS
jgi:hypothetical protein